MTEKLGHTGDRAAMRSIILTQCLGIIALGTVMNGTLLLYLTAVGVTAIRTMIYLAIQPMTNALLLLPSAYLADRYGKKRLGQAGLSIGIIGWGMIATGSFAGKWSEALIVIGIILASVCSTLVSAGWFSLLSPIIPSEIRGRFLGRLRLSFNFVSLIMSAVFAWILTIYSGVGVYQGFYAFATLAFIARWFTYRRIPELEPPVEKERAVSFGQVLSGVFQVKNLAAFCSYIFLLGLFTAGAGALFAMTEKRVLEFSDTQVILLSNFTLIGSMVGMFFGGMVVDRNGTRFVFAVCHVMLALTLVAFLFRVFAPPTLLAPYLGIVHFSLGTSFGAIGIAMTTELLGILPKNNKSVAASLFIIFQTSGVALSGMIPASILKMGILKDSWKIGGHELSSFDAVLLGYGIMTLLLVATLGLVPSMLRKSETASLGLNRL